MSSTNRKRLARTLQHAMPELSYQKALSVAEEALEKKHSGTTNQGGRTAEHLTNVPAPISKTWDAIPLGIVVETGEPYYWYPTQVPNLLIGGLSGRGKTTLVQTIFHHASRWKQWKVIAFDPKHSEFATTTSGEIVTDPIEMLRMLEEVEIKLQQRYEQMHEEGVNSFTLLSNKPQAIMILIDEVWALISNQDDFASEIGGRLSSITRMGRAAGVQVVISSQRPEKIFNVVRNNFDISIGLGSLDSTQVNALRLDASPSSVSRLSTVVGRGLVKAGVDPLVEIQCYKD